MRACVCVNVRVGGWVGDGGSDSNNTVNGFVDSTTLSYNQSVSHSLSQPIISRSVTQAIT